MKYISVNDLNTFAFHDTGIRDIILSDSEMVWSVVALNAMTENPHNEHKKDMCIEKAVITFKDFCVESLVFGAYERYGSDRKLIEAVDAVAAEPEEYAGILTVKPGDYYIILAKMEFAQKHNGTYSVCFENDCIAGNYFLELSFSEVIIEWEEYSGEAWYEDPKWKKK